MNAVEKLVIAITTEWKGRQAILAAQKDVGTFEKSLNILQKRMATTFSVYAVAAFGKASLNAFTQDNLAAQQLSHTLNQLGLAFDDKQVAAYIQQTEKLTGVLDDQLRPALSLFLRTTGSVTKSEELLNTALNISKATGKDLDSVSRSLSRAYYGNYTALQRLGIGINTAALRGKDWQTVQDQLNKTFAGAATVAANSYQGSIDKLKVAVDNAKESIGKGMVDAIKALSSSGTLDAAISGIEKLGSAIGGAVGAMGRFIATSKILLTQGTLTQEQKWAIFGKPITEVGTRGAGRAAVENANARAAAEKKVADQLAAQTKSAQKKLDLSKAELALKKQQTLFDLQAAEIAAALQNKNLTPEERVRLQMMQTADALSAAIKTDTTQAAIDTLTSNLIKLQETFQSMSAMNPFNGAVQGAIALQSQLAGLNAQLQATRTINPLGGAYDLSNYVSVPSPSAGTSTAATTTVNVQIDGQTIASALVNQSASGVPPVYDRSISARLRDSW